MSEKWAMSPDELRTIWNERWDKELTALAAQLEALGNGPPEKSTEIHPVVTVGLSCPLTDRERLWQASCAAMQGLLENPERSGSDQDYGKDATNYARALLAEFNKGPTDA